MAQQHTPAAGSGKAQAQGHIAVVLSAPQGWGKTRKAAALMTEFGCTSVVDEWMPGPNFRFGALHLTNERLDSGSFNGVLVVARGWEGGSA